MSFQGYTDAEIEEYLIKAGEPVLTKTHGKKAVGVMN